MKITRKNTPHYSSRGEWVGDMICCHQTSGSISSCINWFANPESKVSSHFAVAKNGAVYQFVDIDKMAWCNGTNTSDPSKSNHYSKSPNELIREREANANKYTVSIEFENDDTGILTEPQYRAGFELMVYIIGEMKKLYGLNFEIDRKHLIGHCDCSPRNKAFCPGEDFPFERYLADLKGFYESVSQLDKLVSDKIDASNVKVEHPIVKDDNVVETVYGKVKNTIGKVLQKFTKK